METREQIIARLGQKKADVETAYNKYLDETNLLASVKTDLAKWYKDAYKDFLGKRVIIHYFRDDKKTDTRTIDCYLDGFNTGTAYKNDVQPTIYKVKKDGNQSLNRFAEYDTPYAKSIFKIELKTD